MRISGFSSVATSGAIVLSFLMAAERGFCDDVSDATSEVAKAQKEMAENRPSDATKTAEDKLDEAARKNSDTAGDPKTDKTKQEAQKAEDNARSAADQATAASKDPDTAKAYRKALEKRRAARGKLKAAVAKLKRVLQKRRQHTSENQDIEEAVKEAEKALRSAEQPISMVLPGHAAGETVAMLASTGKVKIDTAGTGETIGHVADMKIQNLTDQPINCVVPPMILESGSGKSQHYACPEEKTVRIEPRSTATVPIDGVCLVRNKPPVGKGVTGDLLVNEGNPTIGQNPDSHLAPKRANELLRIAKSKYDAADKLLKNGQLKDIPYSDPKKKKDIVTQWSTWSDPRISELTGAPPASKEDLKKTVYRQLEEQGPVTPDKKKKIDKGIDTIFEKVELTTAKAKDLEEPDPFANVELTGEKGKGETPAGGSTGLPKVYEQPQTVGMPTPSSTSTPSPAPQEKTGSEASPASTPATTVSKALEKPCPNGKLVARHGYSECGPDGFWHVVEDAYYDCPPVKGFRVADIPTDQKCGAGQAPPPTAVGVAYKELSSDCQSPKPTDEFVFVSECSGGFWESKKYRIYECLDGSKRIKSPPDSLVRSTTPCNEAPPAPPH